MRHLAESAGPWLNIFYQVFTGITKNKQSKSEVSGKDDIFIPFLTTLESTIMKDTSPALDMARSSPLPSLAKM